MSILFYAAIIAILIYLFLKWHYSYWRRVGLDYLEPELFFGNTKDLVRKKTSLGNQFANIYTEMKRRGYKQGGFYFFFDALFMPIDLEVIKNILHVDFVHFVNRGIYVNEEFDPLSGHLFALEDDRWRNLRAKLSPAFTSGKLKMMYQTLFNCSKGLVDILDTHAKIQDAIDIKDVAARFTTDVIGSVGFGLECNSLKDPNAEFRTQGRKLFVTSFLQSCKDIAIFVLPPKVLQALNYKFTGHELEAFFLNVVRDTINYREKNDVYRKDFVHMLLQLKNRGKIADDGFIKMQEGEKEGTDFLNFNELAAQCFFFFVAGFETSATTMTFALLELAINQNIQDKLREEIENVLEKYNGELTYDAIKEMKYLDQVVYETLRKHPSAPNLPRQCTKDYKIPGTDVTLKKGRRIIISILGVHHDPDIYPDPQKFDPERFNEENKGKMHPAAFLSFGEGPRYCLGARLGLMQTKVGLVTILRNFKVNVHQQTQLPIQYISQSFILAVDGGVWLTVSKLNQ